MMDEKGFVRRASRRRFLTVKTSILMYPETSCPSAARRKRKPRKNKKTITPAKATTALFSVPSGCPRKSRVTKWKPTLKTVCWISGFQNLRKPNQKRSKSKVEPQKQQLPSPGFNTKFLHSQGTLESAFSGCKTIFRS